MMPLWVGLVRVAFALLALPGVLTMSRNMSSSEGLVGFLFLVGFLVVFEWWVGREKIIN